MSTEKKKVITEQLGVSALGRAIRIGSKAKVAIHSQGLLIDMEGISCATINIKIGKNHEATLIMPIAAFDALADKRNEVEIETIQNHIKQTKKCLKQQLQALSMQS
jgi:hypothetical protein